MTEQSGRQGRLEEVRQERRRRDDATLDGSQALNMPVAHDIQAKLTEQGRTWRWANDVGNRIHRLTVLDDWDKVEGVEPIEVTVNVKKGETCKAYLLSKPIAFMEEDRAKKERSRVAVEKQIVEGNIPDAGNVPASRTDNIYADKANSISRGNQVI